MSLNFVTGKRGDAHISSADWRSLNRGIVGEGKFYLEDTESNSNGDFLVNASAGEITVPPRSFIWSGAHIRNDSLYIASYTPPVSTANVVLWFHYTKDVNTGIENIEFTTTVDSQPSPISDVIEDNTLEAYTAVYSFTHDAENLVAKDGTEFFKNANSLRILEESTRLVANNLAAEVSTRTMQVSNLNRSIEGVNNSVQEIKDSFPDFRLKTQTLLSNGSVIKDLVYRSEDKKLSEYLFFVILRRTELDSSGRVPMFVPAIAGGYSFPEIYTDKPALQVSNDAYVEQGKISITSETNGFRISYSTTVVETRRDVITDVIGYYY